MLRVYYETPRNEHIVCVDEKTGMQALERRYADIPMVAGQPVRREFEYILHDRTARDELLGGRMTGDALAQQVQFPLAFGDESFSALQVLEAPVHGLAKTFDLAAKASALEVCAQCLEFVTPAVGVLSDDRTFRRALRQALAFTEIDLVSETRARIPARVSHQGPADGPAGLAIMVHVLFGHIGVVPQDFLVKAAGLPIMIHLEDLGPHDPLEPMQHDASPQTLERT